MSATVTSRQWLSPCREQGRCIRTGIFGSASVLLLNFRPTGRGSALSSLSGRAALQLHLSCAGTDSGPVVIGVGWVAMGRDTLRQSKLRVWLFFLSCKIPVMGIQGQH